MKKIALLAVCVLFSNSLFSQQWDGATNSIDPVFRNGNVSIGTDIQKEKLTIGGNLRLINSTSTIGFGSHQGRFFGSPEFPYFEIHHYDSGNTPISGAPIPPFGLYLHPGFDRTNTLAGTVPDQNVVLYISTTKKVGIGTNKLNCNECTGYQLFVKDGIKTEKIKVEIAANNGWADYVFKKGYKLMSLKDLQSFININGHLPEVPTTEEAISNGIELKEMNILLLKKIEELTLYTLEQQKNIEEQRKQAEAQNERIKLLEKKLNK